MHSANTKLSNQQEKIPLVLRHQNIISIIISFLVFIISLIFTEVLKSQPPYYEINIVKIFLNIAVAALFGLIAKIALVYITHVTKEFFNLRVKFVDEVSKGIAKLNEITGSALMTINDALGSHTKKVGETFYKGFYRLLTEEKARNSFEQFDSLLRTATSVDSPFRGIVLDFIISSLGSIGEKGFAMVDASVTDYIRYISQVIQKSNKIVMTCIVRPYWFVVDQIVVNGMQVTLPPYINAKGKYGKGEHLKYRYTNTQRYLIIDENMLAEMFLTAYIDKYFIEKVNANDCSVCQVGNNFCTFHHPENRIDATEINDIPEIFWFKNDVNMGRGVDLVYTLVRKERRKKHKELEDRIYVDEPPLDIRFNFINLENGILKIMWNREAQRLTWVNIPNNYTHVTLNPVDGSNNEPKHTFYRKFSKVLKDELKIKIQEHLQLLSSLIDKQEKPEKPKNSPIFTNNVNTIPDENIKKLFAKGEVNFIKNLNKAIKYLISDLNSNALSQVYSNLISFYKQYKIPKVSYVVTHDPLHPDCPVKIARWKFNWDGDGDSCEGILNAQD